MPPKPTRSHPGRLIALAACLACLLLAFAPAPSPKERKGELVVRLVHRSSREVKSPLTHHSVRLLATNHHNHPVWLVLPYYGENPMPKDGTFLNKGEVGQPFQGKKYKGKGGAAV